MPEQSDDPRRFALSSVRAAGPSPHGQATASILDQAATGNIAQRLPPTSGLVVALLRTETRVSGNILDFAEAFDFWFGPEGCLDRLLTHAELLLRIRGTPRRRALDINAEVTKVCKAKLTHV